MKPTKKKRRSVESQNIPPLAATLHSNVVRSNVNVWVCLFVLVGGGGKGTVREGGGFENVCAGKVFAMKKEENCLK